MSIRKKHRQKETPQLKPWLFFGLTFCWSWLFLIPAAISGLSADEVPFRVLGTLGGLGPMLAAVLLMAFTFDRNNWRDFWSRLLSLRKIRWPWWAVIFLAAPLLTGLAALVDRWLGGAGLRIESTAENLSNPLAVLTFLLFILLFGPVPEELGWRGYALDSLQARWNALVASLILGIMWALWHLPLFFIQGTYQFNLGVGTASFCFFLLSIIPQTVFITWIYNNTHRSILSAIMYHFMLNLTGELTAISPRAEGLYFGLWLVAAILVLAVWGSDELRKIPKQQGIGIQNRSSSMEAALHD